MPVEIDGKTFDSHDAAVSHLRKSKPGISDPDAYVATVERKQKGVELKARLAKILENEKMFPDVPTSEETKKIQEIRKKQEKHNQPSSL